MYNRMSVPACFMNDHVSPEITQILREVSDGDEAAKDRLLEAVYNELKRQARFLMSRERSDHTLQPTALVNEAFLKLGDTGGIKWRDRGHFFGIVSRLMRQILVDHARNHNAKKRGGRPHKISLGDIELPIDDRVELILVVNDLLDRLAEIDRTQSQVVEMRFFAGMTNADIAKALDKSERTIGREWLAAKLWLLRELNSDDLTGL